MDNKKRRFKGRISIRDLGIGKNIYLANLSLPVGNGVLSNLILADEFGRNIGGKIPAKVTFFSREGEKEDSVLLIIDKYNVYFEFTFPKVFRARIQANGIRLRSVGRYPRGRFVKWSAYLNIE